MLYDQMAKIGRVENNIKVESVFTIKAQPKQWGKRQCWECFVGKA